MSFLRYVFLIEETYDNFDLQFGTTLTAQFSKLIGIAIFFECWHRAERRLNILIWYIKLKYQKTLSRLSFCASLHCGHGWHGWQTWRFRGLFALEHPPFDVHQTCRSCSPVHEQVAWLNKLHRHSLHGPSCQFEQFGIIGQSLISELSFFSSELRFLRKHVICSYFKSNWFFSSLFT